MCRSSHSADSGYCSLQFLCVWAPNWRSYINESLRPMAPSTSTQELKSPKVTSPRSPKTFGWQRFRATSSWWESLSLNYGPRLEKESREFKSRREFLEQRGMRTFYLNTRIAVRCCRIVATSSVSTGVIHSTRSAMEKSPKRFVIAEGTLKLPTYSTPK